MKQLLKDTIIFGTGLAMAVLTLAHPILILWFILVVWSLRGEQQHEEA
ncbi:TPA: hypothetical protein ACNIOM_001997 [Serratia marcescens]